MNAEILKQMQRLVDELSNLIEASAGLPPPVTPPPVTPPPVEPPVTQPPTVLDPNVIPPEPRTPAGDEYLAAHADVRGHSFYGVRPRAHWEHHGRAEGRPWPGQAEVDMSEEAIVKRYSLSLIANTYYQLGAPVNPEYQPGMTEHIFGSKALKARSFIPEHRLANPPLSRSPAGFPMWDGKVCWGGRRFDNDAQVQAAIQYDKDRMTENERAEAERARTVYLGPIDAASLSPMDRAWLYQKSYEFRDAQAAGGVRSGSLHHSILGGAPVDISRVINDGSYNRPSGPLVPENKELERVVAQAIADAKAGNPPIPQSIVK